MASTRKPKASTNGSDPQRYYVILDLGGGTIVDHGRAPGATGIAAIKAFTKRSDGSYEPGLWKAIPLATWAADGNNLEIETEHKLVSTFKKVPRQTTGE